MLRWIVTLLGRIFVALFATLTVGLALFSSRTVTGVLGTALAVAIATTAGLLAMAALLRNVARSRIRERRRIDSPQGIEVLETIEVGGITQWIQFRGSDRRKPAILFLHGGPGAAEMPLSHLVQDAWERHFVCIQWDQRGAGKTYRANDPDLVRPTLRIETMVSDAIEVIDRIRDRLGVDRIFLHGHSWGSALGALVARRCPERLLAFVGEGQVVSMLLNERVSYDFTLAEARRRRVAAAIAALEKIGRPPYPDGKYMAYATIQRGWLRDFGYGGTHKRGLAGRMFATFRALLLSPDYTVSDCLSYLDALQFSGTAFTTGKAEYLQFDLRPLGPQYDVPVFFFSGRKDYVTPSVVSAAYFDEIVCPHKELVWFENSAHSPQREEPGKYLSEFIARVAPLAEAGGRS